MSASSNPTVYPSERSASERFVETVDLPTPPFPDATAILYRTPSRMFACPPVAGPAACLGAISSLTLTLLTPAMLRVAASASRASCCPTAGFSVWKWMVNVTLPPSTLMSRTKPNETMSRESPGKRTFFSASSTCSCVGIGFLFLRFELFVRGADDGDRFLRGADHRDDAEVLRGTEAFLDHRPVDPFDQASPHCTDEDQRMLGHVLDLQELPDHEELERGADAAGHDDERRRQPHKVMQAREERPVAEDFVDKRIGRLFGRQMDGQSERPRLALDLPLGGPR